MICGRHSDCHLWHSLGPPHAQYSNNNQNFNAAEHCYPTAPVHLKPCTVMLLFHYNESRFTKLDRYIILVEYIFPFGF